MLTKVLQPDSQRAEAPSRWPRGLRALRHYNYRLYFGGQTISMGGTWMQNVGQGWLVLLLTHSPFYLGVVTALQFLPVLLFSLIGGVIADRVPKYRLMIATQSVMGVLALLLAIDVSAGTVRIWHIYILAFLLGIANAMNMPTQQALAVEMVGKDDLLNAVSLNAASNNISRIAGPALAGVLIAAVGVAVCFYINAFSFLAVIAGLLLMRTKEFQRTERSGRSTTMLAELTEGLAYVRRTWSALMIMVLVFAFGSFGWTTNVLFPVFARNVLHVGAVGYGAMTSTFGIGSLLAVSGLALMTKPRRSLMLSGMAAAILILLAFAWSRSYPLSLLLIACLGAAIFCFATQTNTILQTITPDPLRGRVMSVYTMLFVGSQPLGAFVTGSLASAFGAPAAQTIDALVCAAILLAVLGYERLIPASRRNSGLPAPESVGAVAG
jgi:MFS family permease